VAEGFVYYISREGVTGEQVALADNLAAQSAAIMAVSKVPVCVGFGISTPEQAAAVTAAADGVVVGSAIVKIVEKYGASPDLTAQLEAFVRPLVAAAKGSGAS
jgi:tryptophan synthase alpha chain